MTDFLPVFMTPQGESETLESYDAVLRQWPVPYGELDVSTSFGETHVIVSGPEDEPPVVRPIVRCARVNRRLLEFLDALDGERTD